MERSRHDCGSVSVHPHECGDIVLAEALPLAAGQSCYDNAFMGSCSGTVKTERELVEYANGPEAARELTL